MQNAETVLNSNLSYQDPSIHPLDGASLVKEATKVVLKPYMGSHRISGNLQPAFHATRITVFTNPRLPDNCTHVSFTEPLTATVPRPL